MKLKHKTKRSSFSGRSGTSKPYVNNWCSSHKPSSFKENPKSSPLSGTPFPRLDPRRHRSVAFKAMKESLTLKYLTITSYLSFFFTESFSAKALWNLVHSWLITPDVVNTSGVKEPCSTSIILLLYFRFFSFSCLFRMVSSLVLC